jgi:hypothetical protein
MAIFPLSNTVLLGSIDTSGLMENAMFRKICIEITRHILTSVVRADNFDRSIKLGLKHFVKYLFFYK